MGVRAVLEQDPRTSAGTTWPTFAINPRVACQGDTALRVRVLCGLQEWRSSYRIAFEALKGGKRARFPRGSYAMGGFACVSVGGRGAAATGPPLKAAG